jgi:FkbM family methyltransferase
MTFYRRAKWMAKILLGREVFFRRRIRCAREFLGTEYGGYYVCPDGLDRESVVYSFGVGEDISFDLALIDRFGCRVHAFDPTPKSMSWLARVDTPPSFHFHPYGLSAKDERAFFYPPENPNHVSHTLLCRESTRGSAIEAEFKKLGTIMDMLGHDWIDVLKLDIEGAEYEVLADVLGESVPVGQILVEFHHRFPGVGRRRTVEAVALLRERGFDVFGYATIEPVYSFIGVAERGSRTGERTRPLR